MSGDAQDAPERVTSIARQLAVASEGLVGRSLASVFVRVIMAERERCIRVAQAQAAEAAAGGFDDECARANKIEDGIRKGGPENTAFKEVAKAK